MTGSHTGSMDFGRPGEPVTGQARDTLRAHVADLYRAGVSVGVIAGRVGRSGSLVSRLLTEAGVVRRRSPAGHGRGEPRCGKGQPIPHDQRVILRRRVVAEHARGVSPGAIAGHIGRSHNLVRALLAEAAIGVGVDDDSN